MQSIALPSLFSFSLSISLTVDTYETMDFPDSNQISTPPLPPRNEYDAKGYLKVVAADSPKTSHKKKSTSSLSPKQRQRVSRQWSNERTSSSSSQTVHPNFAQ